VTFPLAFAFGFSVASIPGPIIILIASETLRRGPGAAVSVMMAPILLDALVMLPLGLFFQAVLAADAARASLAVIGGALLVWLGIHSMRLESASGPVSMEPDTARPSAGREIPSFFKGLLVHLTSPYPYLYWGTVGSTFVREGFEEGGLWGAAIYPLGFWLGTSAFTVLVIFILARGKKYLSPRFQSLLHRALGVLLMGGGLFLMARALHGLL
jgi:threonine/homoserine/homoserine lactone efflux protein